MPYLEILNAKDYLKLKGCIEHLDKNIEELDFSNLINYLEDYYEKDH